MSMYHFEISIVTSHLRHQYSCKFSWRSMHIKCLKTFFFRRQKIVEKMFFFNVYCCNFRYCADIALKFYRDICCIKTQVTFNFGDDRIIISWFLHFFLIFRFFEENEFFGIKMTVTPVIVHISFWNFNRNFAPATSAFM